ncbi:MAG: VapC toxin family PIN domain ribonuclease [Spirochaetes bacterium]|nr:MAG: VapC toxin family PIN domain ribonuclease [Spirochaetota bacterium]
MSLKYLLDTNILSEPLKATPSSSVMRQIRKKEGECGICSPVWHEILFGMQRLPSSNRKEIMRNYIERVIEPSMQILPYDSHAAKIHACLRAESESIGRPLPFVGSQIAAIALVNDLILVTRNTKDFSIFKDLEVENWFLE